MSGRRYWMIGWFDRNAVPPVLGEESLGRFGRIGRPRLMLRNAGDRRPRQARLRAASRR